MVGLNSNGALRDQVLKLMEEKSRIERDIQNHFITLQTNNVGMDDSLVDAEGYPRNDINVYEVRHARHNIKCLQNDHKDIMKHIEKGLADVHADLRGENREGNTAGTSHTNGLASHLSQITINDNHRQVENEYQYFLKVTHVRPGSPAYNAGLEEGDLIVQLGSVNSKNFINLQQIQDVINHSYGERVQVRVKRGESTITLYLVPQEWAGRGTLGCQLERTAS